MLLAVLLALAPAVAQDIPAPITVRLDHEQFSRGDRARVYVQTAQDGFLVVLHADPQGRVRVLFPLDPTDDAFVRGGRRQELRGRSDRDAIFVDAADGAGTVLAAVSADPFTYDGFVRNDHWDYRSLGAGTVRADPLAGLLDIVRQMSGEQRFEYDAASYVVGRQIAGRYGHDGYGYGYHNRFRLGLSFGYPYRSSYFHDPFYDPFCYDAFWGWSASCYYGYRSRFGFGFGRFGTTFVGGGHTGGGGSRFVIPRDRVRYTPAEVRQRSGSTTNPTIAPRTRDAGTSRGKPRVTRDRPSITRERPSSPRGRPSVTRGGNGGSRPAARPSSGGRRDGGGSGRGRRP
ncbi:MAG: DUF4384 domain-containing protein [Deltaproteobacteria bacterium]|nr:DUF4384 domain-containing protein [Deltaproteobacteria bacterium]